MFKYNGVNFIKTVYRPYCPLISSLFFRGFSDSVSWKKFIGFNYKLQDALEIEGVYYYPDYHLEAFATRAVRHIFRDKTNFQHLQKETLRREKAIISKNRRTDLAAFFQDYLNYQPTLALYHICDDLIEDGLRAELLKEVSLKETDELMSHLNLPLKPNLDQQMKQWFLKTKDIDGFIKRYSWNFSRYGRHHFLSRPEAMEFLKTLEKDKALSRIDRSRLATRKAIKRAKDVLSKKAYYVDVMQFFIYYRTHRTDILNNIFFHYYDQLVAFAERLGLSYEELICCSYTELINQQIPGRSVLQARQKEAVVCFSHGWIKIISGQEVNYFKKLCRDKEISKTITGRSAFPGKISGLVKIIRSAKDFSKLKPGNILVSSMTTPSMVPVMKKAAGFVTDEGGITCHAAILAREMKKPCVIGTKNATKTLKDGDRIEVDAHSGIVKILNK